MYFDTYRNLWARAATADPQVSRFGTGSVTKEPLPGKQPLVHYRHLSRRNNLSNLPLSTGGRASCPCLPGDTTAMFIPRSPQTIFESCSQFVGTHIPSSHENCPFGAVWCSRDNCVEFARTDDAVGITINRVIMCPQPHRSPSSFAASFPHNYTHRNGLPCSVSIK